MKFTCQTSGAESRVDSGSGKQNGIYAGQLPYLYRKFLDC